MPVRQSCNACTQGEVLSRSLASYAHELHKTKLTLRHINTAKDNADKDSLPTVNEPVELEHSSSNDHSSRHLERHATKDILQFAGVRVKCRLIKLLCTPDISICCASWFGLVSAPHYIKQLADY